MFNFNIQTLTIGFYLLILWLLGVSFLLYRITTHYNRLVKGEDKKNLSELLGKILKGVELSKREIENLKEKTAEIEKDSLFHIQKIGFLKFNPFKDIGGEQSFALAFLDQEDNGVVITALHGREETRWYLKRVKKGKGVDFELSKEEKEALKKAGKD